MAINLNFNHFKKSTGHGKNRTEIRAYEFLINVPGHTHTKKKTPYPANHPQLTSPFFTAPLALGSCVTPVTVHWAVGGVKGQSSDAS